MTLLLAALVNDLMLAHIQDATKLLEIPVLLQDIVESSVYSLLPCSLVLTCWCLTLFSFWSAGSTGARPYHCEAPGCGKTFCRKITLTKHVKRTHSGPYMSPALTASPGDTEGMMDDEDLDECSTSAYSPDCRSYRASPALSMASSSAPSHHEQRHSHFSSANTPSPQIGLGVGLPQQGPSSLNVPPRRSSSRLSNHSAPGCIQRHRTPELVPDQHHTDVYPSPALTQQDDFSPSSAPQQQQQQTSFLSPERIVPQFARGNRNIYLPPLRVLQQPQPQHPSAFLQQPMQPATIDLAAHYESAASEWDQRSQTHNHYHQSSYYAPAMPRMGVVEPASPLHRSDLHAPSPTYPQYL